MKVNSQSTVLSIFVYISNTVCYSNIPSGNLCTLQPVFANFSIMSGLEFLLDKLSHTNGYYTEVSKSQRYIHVCMAITSTMHIVMLLLLLLFVEFLCMVSGNK